jgi:amino acid permease
MDSRRSYYRKFQARSRHYWVRRPPWLPALLSNFEHSGQVVSGANNVEDLERIMADAPMLQQKMKPRHLQMIAVGA